MTPALPDLGFDYRFRPPVDADGGPVSTLLVLHGAGGDENSLWPVAESVAPGGAVLSPRGHVDQNGTRWFRRDEAGEIDVDDLHARVDELAVFIAAACDAFDLDAERIWTFGFSNGATAATALALDHPEVLAGGILLAGVAPFRHHGRVLDKKGFLCGHGRSDEQVSTAQYEDVVELLVTAGAEIELHWYDSGHEVTEAVVADAAGWLQRQFERA